MKTATFVATASVCFLGGLFATNAKADEWNHKTIVTINEPARVQNTVLLPGKYVFELANSDVNRDIVDIYSGDGLHLVTTVIGNAASRESERAGNDLITFYETPAGETPAIDTWFYGGDDIGIQFRLEDHGHAGVAGGMK